MTEESTGAEEPEVNAPAEPQRSADVQSAIQAAMAPLQRQLDDERMARKHNLSDDQMLVVNEVRAAHPTMDFEKALRFAALEKPETFKPAQPAYNRAQHGVIPPGGDSPARQGETGKPKDDFKTKMREAEEAKDFSAATHWAHQEFARLIAPHSTTLPRGNHR